MWLFCYFAISLCISLTLGCQANSPQIQIIWNWPYNLWRDGQRCFSKTSLASIFWPANCNISVFIEVVTLTHDQLIKYMLNWLSAPCCYFPMQVVVFPNFVCHKPFFVKKKPNTHHLSCFVFHLEMFLATFKAPDHIFTSQYTKSWILMRAYFLLTMTIYTPPTGFQMTSFSGQVLLNTASQCQNTFNKY